MKRNASATKVKALGSLIRRLTLAIAMPASLARRPLAVSNARSTDMPKKVASMLPRPFQIHLFHKGRSSNAYASAKAATLFASRLHTGLILTLIASMAVFMHQALVKTFPFSLGTEALTALPTLTSTGSHRHVALTRQHYCPAARSW